VGSLVSNARDDFPDPDSPVNTIRALRGRSRLTFLRLCSRAPRMTRRSVAVRVVSSWSGGSATDSRFPIVGTGVTPGVPRPFVADNARTPAAHSGPARLRSRRDAERQEAGHANLR